MVTLPSLLTGLGLFLFGMLCMTDGLKALAGDALRAMLLRFVRGPWSGLCSGALATALVQSSTAPFQKRYPAHPGRRSNLGNPPRRSVDHSHFPAGRLGGSRLAHRKINLQLRSTRDRELVHGGRSILASAQHPKIASLEIFRWSYRPKTITLARIVRDVPAASTTPTAAGCKAQHNLSSAWQSLASGRTCGAPCQQPCSRTLVRAFTTNPGYRTILTSLRVRSRSASTSMSCSSAA
jgi:hypothetical protein